MSMQEAARIARAVQEGCNLSGIALSLSQVCSEALWPEARRIGKGTNWVNKHDIVTVFLDKMLDLNLSGWDQGLYKAVVSRAHIRISE